MSGPSLFDAGVSTAAGWPPDLGSPSAPGVGGPRVIKIIKTVGGAPAQQGFAGGGGVQQSFVAPQPDPGQQTQAQIGWQVTIHATLPAAQRAFELADSTRVMGSAWRLTDDYLPFLGMTGVVSDIAPGAVRVVFPEQQLLAPQGLWFPSAALGRIYVPPPVQQFVPPPPPPPPPAFAHQFSAPPVPPPPPLATDFSHQEVMGAIQNLMNALPAPALAATLRSVIEAAPHLGESVLQSLQSARLQCDAAPPPPDANGGGGSRRGSGRGRRASEEAADGDEVVLCHSRSDTGQPCGVMRAKKHLQWSAALGCWQCRPGFHCLEPHAAAPGSSPTKTPGGAPPTPQRSNPGSLSPGQKGAGTPQGSHGSRHSAIGVEAPASVSGLDPHSPPYQLGGKQPSPPATPAAAGEVPRAPSPPPEGADAVPTAVAGVVSDVLD